MALVYLYTDVFAPLKNKATDIASPFYSVTHFPKTVSLWFSDRFTSKARLHQENKALKTELLIHQKQLQSMASLVAENIRLRELLNSSKTLDDRVLIAELIGVTPNPLEHKVIINRGSNDGAYIGQPVLDAMGLMGQVVHVGDSSAQVLLITDSTHALPVQLNRTSERFVAEGVGNLNELVLRYVPNTTDIQVGDMLVSSGLGQRFPKGYPVAMVSEIKRDQSKPFVRVVATPKARLNRSRYVLLVFDTAPDAPAIGGAQFE